MRASTNVSRVSLEPGVRARVEVEITNTTQVIDGVVLSLRSRFGDDDLEGLAVRCEPSLLPLFPDGTGVIALELLPTASYPAGAHEFVIEVRSTVTPSEGVDILMGSDVTPAPGAKVEVLPPVKVGKHRVNYSVVYDNTGNTPLDVNLAGSDPEHSVTARFSPPGLVVAPGRSATADMSVQSRRHLLGGERNKQITVLASAPDLDLDTKATFKQQPVIPRGARTVLILGTIVALWAAIFVVVIGKAISKDPMTKEVPASFYAAAGSTKKASAAGQGLTFTDAATGAAPAGAVPKSGVVIGIGGTISGTVDARSTGKGIGRITVEAIQDTPKGNDLISSSATADDGTFSMVGLLPGTYKLLFTAQGYQDVWYPQAPTEAAAKGVAVNAMETTAKINTTITGANGTISGTVDTGQTPQVPVTVTVQGFQGSTTPIATVTTDSAGNYSIPNLPAPGTYDLSFSAAGYQTASDTEEVSGGEHHIASTIDLSAGTGTIAGTVTDGANPLGGVTITAAANGQTVTSATPTTGAVGQFTIPNLTTPNTYLITFTKDGYGTQTVAEYLAPGQTVSNMSVTMPGGAGTISGLVTSTTGTPLGGVSVSVSGGTSAAPITTQSLTAGTVGSYELSGLATPGNYTLTFSLAGYSSETIGVNLGSSGSATGTNVALPTYAASLTGTVVCSIPAGATAPASCPKDGTALTGVTVSVTGGNTPQTTITSSSPPGGYAIGGLTPESYSVTFSLTGYRSQTALVTVQPGQAAVQNITLVASS